MDYNDIQQLINAYNRRLELTSLDFKRYLYDKINWNARLIGIKGARGVGKTTLIIQHIKETFSDYSEAMYVSLDNLWFNDNSLPELVEFLYTHGVKAIYLDEVHKLNNWQTYIKNIYDDYPDLKIVYTGSAMLQIDHSVADLSRRQSLHTLHGLSFLEYLEYNGILKLKPIPFKEILKNHVSYAREVVSQIKVLKYFEEYLNHGFYPFFKEAESDYMMRVSDSSRAVIETDIPAVEKVSYGSVEKLKTLLMVISKAVPFEVNVTRLAEQLETTRDQTLKMLSLLGRAALINVLGEKVRDYKHLVGAKKIYLDNTNLMYALSDKVEKGTIRETFFANQAQNFGEVTIPAAGDFLIDGKYLFEVGGRRKSFSQIADIPNSYLAVDDIEIGIGNRIPLWLFGCTY